MLGCDVVQGETPLQMAELPDNFRPFAPPLPMQYGTHHSKFVILGYPLGIRVVLLTANHIHSDHYEMTDGCACPV